VDDNTIHVNAFFRQYQSRLASFQLNATNNGHSVEINLEPRQLFLSGSLFPDLYQAMSVHWHMPSEHVIDGIQYAAEMHVVYMPIDRTFWTDGRPPLLVRGFLLYELDDSTIPPADLPAWQKTYNDSLLNEIVNQKTLLSTIGQVAPVKFVPRMPFMDTFYVYDGSLTTPVCKETVMWWLSPIPIKVPKRQLTDLSSLLRQEHGGEGDSRPV
jgi:carbonic anhydrase